MTTVTQPTKIGIHDIANRLREAADEPRANSHQKAAKCSIPVLLTVPTKSDLHGSPWKSCDELRGGMDPLVDGIKESR